MAITFCVLVIIHFVWGIINLIYWLTYGLQSILEGMNFIERIYYSVFLKWMLLADLIWGSFALAFLFSRKHFKTDTSLHYLTNKPIEIPKICVIIPTFNEEKSIEKVVMDYLDQKYVKYVIVIDNNSSDTTTEKAKNAGAIVINKNKNLGFAHSYVMGLKKGLETDANLFLTSEADGTYNGYDVAKFLSYIQNSDMVIGTRFIQILTEKGNQNKLIHIWGNLLVAKLIQIKFFNLHHLGAINLTDVGCLSRMMRRTALEKIIDLTTYPNSENVISGSAISIHLTILGLQNDLRIVEIPITFNSRIGYSKTKSNELLHGIKYGIKFIWFTLSC